MQDKVIEIIYELFRENKKLKLEAETMSEHIRILQGQKEYLQKENDKFKIFIKKIIIMST